MPEKSLLPFIILGLGFVWAALFEWLRRRSAPPSSDGSVAPSAQHLVLVGMGGLLLCMIAAAVAAKMKWFP